MITKLFGQFLLEKGVINREQLLEAIDSQRRQSPLLGELAVKREWMTEATCDRVNAIQMQRDMRFGDIAIDLELLTEAQLSELIEEQRKQRPYIGEVLVSLGHITSEQLEQNLSLHKQDRIEIDDFFDEAISRCPEPKSAHAITDVFPKLYNRICKRPIALSEMKSAVYLESGDHFEHCWYQDLHINGEYRILFATTPEHGLEIGSAFMSMPLTEWNALSIDAVNEFLNTFVGHIYHQITDVSAANKVSPPKYEPQYDLGVEKNGVVFEYDNCEHQCLLVLMWQTG